MSYATLAVPPANVIRSYAASVSSGSSGSAGMSPVGFAAPVSIRCEPVLESTTPLSVVATVVVVVVGVVVVLAGAVVVVEGVVSRPVTGFSAGFSTGFSTGLVTGAVALEPSFASDFFARSRWFLSRDSSAAIFCSVGTALESPSAPRPSIAISPMMSNVSVSASLISSPTARLSLLWASFFAASRRFSFHAERSMSPWFSISLISPGTSAGSRMRDAAATRAVRRDHGDGRITRPPR